MFVVIGSAVFANGIRQKEFFWFAFGVLFAALPLLMSLVISRTVFYIEAALGLLVLVVALTRKKRMLPGLNVRRSGSESTGWPWAGSSSGDASGGSSSDSSSSSDFGGGDSGGGGSSGSW